MDSNLFVPLDHLCSHINSAKHIQDAFEIESKQRKLATLNTDQSNNEITRKTCGTAEGLKLLCLLQIRLSLQVPRKNRNDCKHKQKFSGYGKSFFKSGRLDQPRAEAIWRGPERTFQPIARAALSDAWDGVKQPGSSCVCDALPPTLKKNGGYCCLKQSKTGQHLHYQISLNFFENHWGEFCSSVSGFVKTVAERLLRKIDIYIYIYIYTYI